MKNWYFLFPLIAAVLLPSCSTVSTKTPVAEKTEVSLQKEFRGSWIVDDGIIHLDFDADGVGWMAATEWEDNQFKTSHGTFYAVRSETEKDRGFISVREEDENDADGDDYFFCAFKLTNPGEIVIWEPAPMDNYRKLIQGDQLAGDVVGKSKSVIFADGAGLVTKLDDLGNYFDLEDPLIMKRAVPKE